MAVNLTLKEKIIASQNYARNHFACYCIGMWDKYQVAKHHRLLISKLENVLRGTIKRLIVTMPPRHSKSLTTTQMFPGFYLGHKPDKSIIMASYGDSLATDFGRYVRNSMQTSFYENIFPEVKISDDSSSNSRFHTNKGGALFAVGRGGTITGRGGDLIIIDDIFKNRTDANSPQIRKSVLDWYKSTLRTRLQQDGAIVIVNTRWHQDDLIGHLLANDTESDMPWEHLNLKAIDENNNPLWPEKFPLKDLLQIKKEIGTYEFEALYQQNPTPAEGGIIKRNWIKFYKEKPATFQIMLQSWDMTFKETENSDFVVGQVWGMNGSNFYLVDQVRARMDFVSTKNAFQALTSKYPQATTKLVEDKANGSAIISELKNQILGIKPINPTSSKAARLSAVSPLFEAGNVHLPDPLQTSWMNDYIEELVGFPQMKNDDCVDSTTQALLELKEFSAHRLTKLLTL